MNKHWTALMMMIMSFFVLPVSAFAEAKNPMEMIKEKLTFNFKVVEGMDFLFTPLGIALSILVIAGIILLIVRVVWRIIKVSTGKATLKDKWFWIECGIVLLVIFLIMSGAFLDILGAIFDWTSDQELVDPSKTTE